MFAPSGTRRQVQGTLSTPTALGAVQGIHNTNRATCDQADTQSAALPVLKTERISLIANLFRRTLVSLHSTELLHVRFHSKTKRGLLERCHVHWLREFCKTPPHHFGGSFTRCFGKLHQFTKPFYYYFYK